MKACKYHIEGINRTLQNGWEAKRCRAAEQSILVGHEDINRCALITCAGYGGFNDTHFVTVHEEHARSMSETGFVQSESYLSGDYDDWELESWYELERLLYQLSCRHFNTWGDYHKVKYPQEEAV